MNGLNVEDLDHFTKVKGNYDLEEQEVDLDRKSENAKNESDSDTSFDIEEFSKNLF